MSDASARPEPNSLRTRWPLVDRDGLVDRLVETLDHTSVMVDGYAGVGKTAIARLVGRALEDDGRMVRRTTATFTGRTAPFSALAPVVDLGGGAPSLAALVDALTGDGSRAGVLVVDDAQWLDPGSARLIDSLTERDDVRVLATVRTGEPGSDDWSAAADDGRLSRLTLDTADRDLIDRIVTAVLGARVSPSLIDDLTASSGGNLLYLREVLLAGIESGAVRQRARRWTAVAPLPSDGGVGAAVARRIRSLDHTESTALAAVALVEPVAAELVLALPWGDRIPALERRGLLASDGGILRVAHPLLADGARSALTPGELRSTLDRTTEDVLGKLASFDSDLALRLVSMRVAHGMFVPLEGARAGASRAFALLDHDLAVELGRHALDIDPDDVEANLTVGAALSAQFAGDAAEQHLRAALTHARTDGQRARAAGRLGLHLGTRHGRRDDALALMRTHLARLTDPAWQRFLAADLGKIELLAGESVSGPPGGSADAEDPVADLNQAITTALVAALAGDVSTAEQAVARGLPLTADHVTSLPNARDLLLLGAFVARLAGGRTDDARTLADAELEACRGGRDEPVGMWLALLTAAALGTGDPARADEYARRAIPLLERRDFVGGLAPTTRASRAVALAQLGRTTEARDELASIDPIWHDDPRTRATMRQATAWCDTRTSGAAAGDRLAAAAEDVAASGLLSVALPIAHDAVRLGDPAPVVGLLASFAERAPDTVAPVFHRHAVAAASGDPEERLAAAELLDGHGMVVFAAEARLAAAGIVGDERRARWLRATATAALVEAGVEVPSNGSADTPTHRLTARQLEIAQLAASRRRSKEIAASLGLSVRTVDNVLGHVYRLLGVSSRDELRAVLGTGPDGASGAE